MVLNAAAVKSPTTFTGGLFDNALGFDDIPDLYPSFTTLPFSEGSDLSINDSTNSSTLLMAPTPAYWDVHHGMTTGPVKPKQLPWDIYHPAATLGSLANRQQWLHQELCNSLCTHKFNPTPNGGSNGSYTGSNKALKHPSLDEVHQKTSHFPMVTHS